MSASSRIRANSSSMKMSAFEKLLGIHIGWIVRIASPDRTPRSRLPSGTCAPASHRWSLTLGMKRTSFRLPASRRTRPTCLTRRGVAEFLLRTWLSRSLIFSLMRTSSPRGPCYRCSIEPGHLVQPVR